MVNVIVRHSPSNEHPVYLIYYKYRCVIFQQERLPLIGGAFLTGYHKTSLVCS